MWHGKKGGLEIEHVKTWWCGAMPLALLGANRRVHAGLSRGLRAGPEIRALSAQVLSTEDSVVPALPLHFPLRTKAPSCCSHIRGHVWRRWRREPLASWLGSPGGE